jgi:hypothetical protein
MALRNSFALIGPIYQDRQRKCAHLASKFLIVFKLRYENRYAKSVKAGWEAG